MHFLFELEDVFDISGRGCVLVPGIPYASEHEVRVGSEIVIQRPDGSLLETSISGFEMINRGRAMEHAPFSVPRRVAKEDLPLKSRVFLK